MAAGKVAGAVVISLLTDATDLVEGLAESENALLRFAGVLIDALVITPTEVVRGIQSLIDMLNNLFLVYDKQIQVNVQLEAVIRATGMAAGFTAKELQAYATELQNIISVSDATIGKAQAVLLTFDKLSGESFKRATKAAFDMAAVLGTDTVSAALRLGRALEEPIKGVERLERIGINFTIEQKDLIEAFLEFNDVASAQVVILDAIESSYKGVAAAQAETIGGRANVLWLRLINLAEKVFESITPLIDIVIDLGRVFLFFFEPMVTVVLDLVKAFSLLIATLAIFPFFTSDLLGQWKEFLGLVDEEAKKSKDRLRTEIKITEEKRKQLRLFTPLEQFAFDIERAAEETRVGPQSQLFELATKRNRILMDRGIQAHEDSKQAREEAASFWRQLLSGNILGEQLPANAIL